MTRYVKRRRHKHGLSPGSVVFVGDKKDRPVEYSVIDYGPETFDEVQPDSLEAVLSFRDKPTISWINVNGVHDVDLVQRLGAHFNLHPLTLEDIVNTGQRPKVEEHDDHLYLVVKMLYFDEHKRQLKAEQVSLIVGSNYVLSLQEEPGDVFEAVRNRIRSGKGRIRRLGADYLAYALLDVIVDHYFIVLETVGDLIESLEEEVLQDPTSATLLKINDLRRELILMRRAVWPVRELVHSFERSDVALLSSDTKLFLRDAYDHAVQVIDIVESLRDVLSGLTDLYISNISNRMNEVMKFLTIIGTIFIPLTFIAGIYGMNFDYMPELHVWYAYPLVLAAMVLMTVALIFYFRRRDWL